MIPNGSIANEGLRNEKSQYEDILIFDSSNVEHDSTAPPLMSQAVINFVSKWGRQHKWVLFGDRNSTNFLNAGMSFS